MLAAARSPTTAGSPRTLARFKSSDERASPHRSAGERARTLVHLNVPHNGATRVDRIRSSSFAEDGVVPAAPAAARTMCDGLGGGSPAAALAASSEALSLICRVMDVRRRLSRLTSSRSSKTSSAACLRRSRSTRLWMRSSFFFSCGVV